MINLLILLLGLFPGDDDFREIFGDHYESSSIFLNEEATFIDSLSSVYQVDNKIISAIIFPELIRYSIIRDFVEVNTLEIVYVNTGMADFSIGPVQIKPSFAAAIEELVESKNVMKKHLERFDYKSDLQVEIRKERLNRLKNFRRQMDYVMVFQKYMFLKFPFLKKESLEYQVKFLSTAYNYDFKASRRKIEEYMNRSFFPWGAYNNRKKYNYADIAWFYYQEMN